MRVLKNFTISGDFMGSKKEKIKLDKEAIERAALSGSNAEIVQRYGSAVKEYVTIYNGVDNETGKVLQKSLKSVSKSKVNPEYAKQNIKQQAGFSAELMDTANTNADNIINKNPTRKVRADDVGKVNDQLYDTLQLDANGKIIEGSGTQIKFVGNSPEDALKKLASKKFEKYYDNDVPVEVPSDYYDKIISSADQKIKELEQQYEKQISLGKTETAEKTKAQIAKYKKIREGTKKSTVSNKEAMIARTKPTIATAKKIGKVSNQAGIEAAKVGAVVGGATSVVQNVVSLVKGEIDAEEAAKNVAKDTGKAAAFSYGSGFAGAAVKGIMQNAGSEYVRALSKTNLAGTAVNVAVTSTKVISKYVKGEIDGVECVENLGKEGVGLIASSMGATIGQALIPIPVVGAMVGSMVGYAISSASYDVLKSALEEEKLSKEERQRVEKECEEQIALIREYREELEKLISQYLTEKVTVFHDAFDGIKAALDLGDIDGFIIGANMITKNLGNEVQFESMQEFDEIMNSDISFKL